MIVAIDGTGEADNVKYDKEMQGSFCNQIGRVGYYYLRGPALFGAATSAIADRAASS